MTVLTIHGRRDKDDPDTVFIGGLDTLLRDRVGEALRRAGFVASESNHEFPATNPANICNRGRRQMGVQLEIPGTLRDRIRADQSALASFGDAISGALD